MEQHDPKPPWHEDAGKEGQVCLVSSQKSVKRIIPMQGEETCSVEGVLGTSTDSEPKIGVSSEGPETYVSTQTCNVHLSCGLHRIRFVSIHPFSFRLEVK